MYPTCIRRSFASVCLLFSFLAAAFFLFSLYTAESAAEKSERSRCSSVAVAADSGIEIGIAGVWKPGVWTPVILPETLAKAAANRAWTIEAIDDDGLSVSYPASGRFGRFRIGSPNGSIKITGPFVPLSDESASDPQTGSAETNAGSVETKAGSVDANDKVAASQISLTLRPAISSHKKVYMVLGTETEAEFVRRSIARTDMDKNRRPLVVRLDSPDLLRGDYLSLQAIDRIIWFQQREDSGRAPNASNDSSGSGNSNDSNELLDRWVLSGGDLTVSRGNASMATEPSNDKLNINNSAEFNDAPGRLVNTTALEEFAGSEIPIPRLGLGKQYAIPVQNLEPPADAQILCRYLNFPLIFRYTEGFGQRTILAFDLGHESILQWSNRDKLLCRILDIQEKIQETQAFSTNAILHYGYDDLPGQLASALDQYPNTVCVSFWSIAAALLIYILLIGAGDYFLWRRLGLPVQLSWVSFPLYLILFCGLFYFLAVRAKGNRIQANSVVVCDSDLASGSQRVYFYGAVFVPQADRYTIRPLFNGRVFDWVGWGGSTGQGISGMNYPARFTARSDDAYSLQTVSPSQSQAPNLASGAASGAATKLEPEAATKPEPEVASKSGATPSRPQISDAATAEFNGIPLAAWMSRNIVAGAFQEGDKTGVSKFASTAGKDIDSSASNAAPPTTFLGIQVSLADDLGKPVGELENRSTKTWEDSLLVYGAWAFPLGKLKPGQKIAIDDSLERFSLDAVLVGKRVNLTNVDIAERYSNETQPYNPTDQDIENIVRTMLFYRASGGLAYTKLENGYQAPVDFSSLITNNRAVLLVRESDSEASNEASNEVSTDISAVSSAARTGVLVQNEFFPSRWIFRRFVIPVGAVQTR